MRGGGDKGHQFARIARKFGGDWNAPKKSLKIKAFTLAEVLITLAIIGVVAALTIPSVITNYRKNLYVTQLKKEYNYIINAFHTAMANDGVMQLSDTKLFTSISPIPGQYAWSVPDIGFSSKNILKDERSASKEEFLKIFNVVAIYDGDVNKIPVNNNEVSYKQLNGKTVYDPGELVMNNLVCLADGACFSFGFLKDPSTSTKYCGDRRCNSLKEFQNYYNTPTKLWQYVGSIYIDVNGFKKGPNQTGRDWFHFHVGNDGNLYPYGGIDVAVYDGNSYTDVIAGTASSHWKYNDNERCNPNNSSRSGEYCVGRIMEEGWKMNY